MSRWLRVDRSRRLLRPTLNSPEQDCSLVHAGGKTEALEELRTGGYNEDFLARPRLLDASVDQQATHTLPTVARIDHYRTDLRDLGRVVLEDRAADHLVCVARHHPVVQRLENL